MSDQLPPHSIPDEQGVIACCIEDSLGCLPECGHVTEGYFYDERHKLLWRTIQGLQTKNQPIDSVTVARCLMEQDQRQIAVEYLPTVLDSIPTTLSLPNYLPTLTDYAIKRKIIRGCVEVSRAAFSGLASADLMSKAESLLSFERPDSAKIFDGQAAGRKMIDDLQRRHELNGALPGLDTGWRGLNDKLDGLQYGEQTIIGARPSQGKTAIGLCVFAHACLTLGVPSLFVSLEMSTAALMRRMCSGYSEIPMNKIRRGIYNDDDFKKFTTFQARAKKSPLYILDGVEGLGISEICAKIRRHVRQHQTKLVVLDYLQKIKPSERHEKRTYEVGEISGRLKSLAVETGAAFLTLAQINRESDKQRGKQPGSGIPRLSDLADSGQIERDADTVILIHRDKADDTGATQLIIAKQRDGEVGFVPMVFNGRFCRFEEPRRISNEDVPRHYTEQDQ